ncbi:hypothetical protein TSUD_337720 [Trifolium subterraneum]|uniref:Auxin response factor domain-containing protein n=1 Tax=Trifolium subterraneum TaxID=3900 RepID=A0A2Z6MCH7_TRISU|nr:hypothetical protein TSUD_337720 [Trifolium subterraneum]
MKAKRKGGNLGLTEMNKESKTKLRDLNRSVDPQLWHAIAGGMVQMPEVNSKIFYFPQGHAEHACELVNFSAHSIIPHKIPSLIPCRVESIKYMADPETDEVFAKLRLVPMHISQVRFDDDDGASGIGVSETKDKHQCFAKTLTQSDSNNGGGFSCPRYCAETLFPNLDYSEMKPSSGIGIRPDLPYGVFTSYSGEEDNKLRRNGKGNGLRISDGMMGRGKVKAQEVIEAVKRSTNMEPFDVVYYPRAGTPEFFVKISLIGKALQIRWCHGMRFKMAIETEDSTRISWFVGTVVSVQASDPAWPESFWRFLQVEWDEPELLKNVKRVNPWQVEIVSNMPLIPLSPYVPPRKKLRLPQHPNYPLDGQFSMPTFPNNFLSPNVPIFHLPETTPVGMQGARHPHFGFSSSSFHLNKFPLGLFKPSFQQPFNHTATTSTTVPYNSALQKPNTSENASCSLSISTSTQSSEKSDRVKPSHLMLFGQKITIENKISSNTTADAGNENIEKKITNNFSDLHLQGLPKCSPGDRFETNRKN